MSYPYGIDSAQLAWYQTITAAELAEIDFHICRIGSMGQLYMGQSSWYNKTFTPDSYCLSNIQATQAAGKPMGVYLFSYAWDATSAIKEANVVCDTLDSWGVSLELPIFLDWESTGTSAGSYESFQTYIGHTVTTAELETIFQSFHQRCINRGRRAGMYFNGWFYNYLLPSAWINSQRAAGNYFWLAQWQNTPDPPYDCDIWQYAGDKYYIGNVSTNYPVDQNYLINPAIVGGKLPIWLQLYLAQRGERNGKCTILL